MAGSGDQATGQAGLRTVSRSQLTLRGKPAGSRSRWTLSHSPRAVSARVVYSVSPKIRAKASRAPLAPHRKEDQVMLLMKVVVVMREILVTSKK